MTLPLRHVDRDTRGDRADLELASPSFGFWLKAGFGFAIGVLCALPIAGVLAFIWTIVSLGAARSLFR